MGDDMAGDGTGSSLGSDDRVALAELVSGANAAQSRLTGQFPATDDLAIHAARAALSGALDGVAMAASRLLTGSGSAVELVAAADRVDAALAEARAVVGDREGLFGAPDVGLLPDAARLAAGS